MEHKNRSITRVTTMNKGRRKKCLKKENKKIKKKRKNERKSCKERKKKKWNIQTFRTFFEEILGQNKKKKSTNNIQILHSYLYTIYIHTYEKRTSIFPFLFNSYEQKNIVLAEEGEEKNIGRETELKREEGCAETMEEGMDPTKNVDTGSRERRGKRADNGKRKEEGR